MKLSIEVTESSLAGLRALEQSIAKAVHTVAEKAMDTALAYYTLEVEAIFDAEGPNWPSLAPQTTREREATGFPPDHPILYRTGALKASLTDPDAGLFTAVVSAPGQPDTSFQSGNIIRKDVSGGNSEATFASVDPRFPVLQDGGYSQTGGLIPARPMLPRGEVERLMAQKIGKELFALMENHV